MHILLLIFSGKMQVNFYYSKKQTPLHQVILLFFKSMQFCRMEKSQ